MPRRRGGMEGVAVEERRHPGHPGLLSQVDSYRLLPGTGSPRQLPSHSGLEGWLVVWMTQ